MREIFQAAVVFSLFGIYVAQEKGRFSKNTASHAASQKNAQAFKNSASPVRAEIAERLPVRGGISLPAPAQTGVPDSSRTVCLEEETKRQVEDSELLLAIGRFPQGMAERETHIERPGWRSFLGDFPDDGEGYGGNPRRLDRPRYQSHGPVAGASGRDQQGIVHPGDCQFAGDLRGGLLLKCL
jgi:hypothetical protein